MKMGQGSRRAAGVGGGAVAVTSNMTPTITANNFLVPMTSNVVTVVVKPGQSAVDALVKIGAASAKAASKWDRAMRRKVDVK